jgi:hypothetical protein
VSRCGDSTILTQRELSPAQFAAARAHGLSPEDIARQLRFYASPPPFSRLIRPCVAGHGIRILDTSAAERLAARYGDILGRRSVVCFVPASGAASRMFKVPLAYMNGPMPVTIDALRREAARSSDSRELLELAESLPRFAFFEELVRVAATVDFDATQIRPDADLRPLLRALLGPDGLDYANLPKGLLAFHRYADGPRTAFEEHLVEAARYGRDSEGVCRLHFTVSDEHMDGFRALADRVLPVYSARFSVRYDVAFSTQHSSTDSFAVTPDGGPFLLADQSLLFRPGGHGALIENLAAIHADVVFVKNIDNVVPDHAKGDTILWRRVLGAVLLETQARIFSTLDALDHRVAGALDAAAALLAELGIDIAHSEHGGSESVRGLLERPLRVCGMVRNTGEPGGGPFWVTLDGRPSAQIVETSQVDTTDPAQREILAKATHFNPVDIACAPLDRHGRAFDLHRFVDEDAVFIVEKSKDGRLLRSLERPGLWNGGMARWNTLFVEVPSSTFNPVKTVNALLSPAHQPR